MEGKYHDLGKKPKKLNDVDKPEKMSYPCMYDITPENFPPMMDMKLGSTGEAMIKFKIKTSGGIEVLSMKMMGETKQDKKEAKSNGNKSGSYEKDTAAVGG